MPFEAYQGGASVSCDRDAQGDCWFTDVAVTVLRPRNLERIAEGVLPQRWMGRKIRPIHNVGGLDIDEEWQLPLIEGYLLRNGFTAERTPYGP